jgi:hypothetical protein
MRIGALLATTSALAFAQSASAQSFVYGVGPGGPRYYYAPGYGGYSARGLVGPAARPYNGRAGAGLLAYNPRDGYFYSPSYGLPWSAPGYPNAPIDRRSGLAYSRAGVVRYSRPNQEPNDTYYARSALALPEINPNIPGAALQPAVAEADEQPIKKPAPLPRSRVGTGGATRKSTATRRPSGASYGGSSSAIRSSGGADWVPSVPSRW